MKSALSSFAALVLGASVAALLAGCTLFKAVTVPVQLAATGVVAVGETAGAVVATSGKLAAGAVRAAGSLGASGIDAAARLAQDGMVTFVQANSGEVARAPWLPGARLADAALAARVTLGTGGIELLRTGQRVLAAKSSEAAVIPVAAGDVVRVLAEK